jgi:methoxymalonate biosynthesis acyl carrier protein
MITNSMKATEESIMALLLKEVNVEVPSSETDLLEAGVLDSLKLAELLSHLESRFGMRISVEDLEVDNFRSIARMAAFLQRRATARSASPGE